jgi:GTPase SAR1 family protein
MNADNISKFPVKERFLFLEQLTTMVCNNQARSLLLLGSGGLGKTTMVMNTVESTGVEYKKIGGTSSARGLYNTLYDNNGKLLIFDDCDAVLKDKTSTALLKIALDSNDDRIISWNKQLPKGSEYPQEFEFTGRIIFISNLKIKDIDQAVLTRGYKVNLTMTEDEKIERMTQILPSICKKQKFETKSAINALKFIKSKKSEINDLNLRTLLDVIRIVDSGVEKWERLAEYSITN